MTVVVDIGLELARPRVRHEAERHARIFADRNIGLEQLRVTWRDDRQRTPLRRNTRKRAENRAERVIGSPR